MKGHMTIQRRGHNKYLQPLYAQGYYDCNLWPSYAPHTPSTYMGLCTAVCVCVTALRPLRTGRPVGFYDKPRGYCGEILLLFSHSILQSWSHAEVIKAALHSSVGLSVCVYVGWKSGYIIIYTVFSVVLSNRIQKHWAHVGIFNKQPVNKEHNISSLFLSAKHFSSSYFPFNFFSLFQSLEIHRWVHPGTDQKQIGLPIAGALSGHGTTRVRSPVSPRAAARAAAACPSAPRRTALALFTRVALVCPLSCKLLTL